MTARYVVLDNEGDDCCPSRQMSEAECVAHARVEADEYPDYAPFTVCRIETLHTIPAPEEGK